MLTTRDFLIRGLLAGLVAGFLTFGVAYFVGEPSVDAAIALEESADDGAEEDEAAGHSHGEDEEAGHSHGDEEEGTEVSRGIQASLGLLTVTALLGAVLGGLAGVVTALGVGRLGRIGVRGTALSVAAAGFVVLYFVPYLIHPPNPPAVGSGDTIGERTGAYFTVLGISGVVAVLAVVAASALRNRVEGWYAGLAGIAGYVVVMTVVVATMPRLDEVGDFPGQLLFDFRISSLLTALALYAFIGVIIAELGQRLVASTLPETVEAKGDPVDD